jgi:chemotaxis protein MotA
VDLGTIIGVVIGVGLVFSAIITGGGLGMFMNVPSLLIVCGGTTAAVLMAFPLSVAKRTFGVLMRAFLHKAASPQHVLELIVHYAEVARRDGMLALEEEAEKAPDDFLKKALRLAVDGTDAELIGMILRLELRAQEERHTSGQNILLDAAAYAPAFGMIGTLIGLIQMLRTLDDPSSIGAGMAVALVTSFWGSFLANIVFNPLAGKLKNRTREEKATRMLVIEGVTSIQGGDSPRIVKEKLHTFLSPASRLALEEKVKA